MWYSPSHDTTNTVILVLDYNTVSNIISLYIFEILINVASHSCINQSMYKISTVDIQTGHPSASWIWAFKVELRSFQGCVFSYNILGHIMTVCYHYHQIIYLIHILQINILPKLMFHTAAH